MAYLAHWPGATEPCSSVSQRRRIPPWSPARRRSGSSDSPCERWDALSCSVTRSTVQESARGSESVRASTDLPIIVRHLCAIKSAILWMPGFWERPARQVAFLMLIWRLDGECAQFILEGDLPEIRQGKRHDPSFGEPLLARPLWRSWPVTNRTRVVADHRSRGYSRHHQTNPKRLTVYKPTAGSLANVSLEN